MNVEESTYSDFRSENTPKRRENALKAKYNLRFRDGRNFAHNNPQDRAFCRIDELCARNRTTHYMPTRDHWKIPISQQVKHYGIKKHILQNYPEGQSKREFVEHARSENKIRRCRCRDYCFMRFIDGVVAAKRQRKREIESDYNAWVREDWDADVDMDLYMEERITQYGWDRDRIPIPYWGGILDKIKTSKKLRRRGPFRLVVEEDSDEDFDETDFETDFETVLVEELEEGVDWEVVEYVGFLSDAESWQDDFDTESCWSV